jgi:hypothetical protein
LRLRRSVRRPFAGRSCTNRNTKPGLEPEGFEACVAASPLVTRATRGPLAGRALIDSDARAAKPPKALRFLRPLDRPSCRLRARAARERPALERRSRQRRFEPFVL